MTRAHHIWRVVAAEGANLWICRGDHDVETECVSEKYVSAQPLTPVHDVDIAWIAAEIERGHYSLLRARLAEYGTTSIVPQIIREELLQLACEASRERGRLVDYLLAAKLKPEADIIDHIKAHWFTQGGEAQFGPLDLPAENADGIVSAILEAVRKKPADHSPEKLWDAITQAVSTHRSPETFAGCDHPNCLWLRGLL